MPPKSGNPPSKTVGQTVPPKLKSVGIILPQKAATVSPVRLTVPDSNGRMPSMSNSDARNDRESMIERMSMSVAVKKPTHLYSRLQTTLAHNRWENELYYVRGSIRKKNFEDCYLFRWEAEQSTPSSVRNCRDRDTRMPWAVKIVHKETTNPPHDTGDISHLFGVNHRNILRLREIFERFNDIHIVSELAEGGTVLDRVSISFGHTELIVSDIIRQMLCGLEYLHGNDIVHRNVKPKNILYSNERDDATIKLADFGLSSIICDNNHVDCVALNPAYCAPELMRARKKTSAVDIWSVGVFVYVLLCGEEPFYSEDNQTEYRNILKCKYSMKSPEWNIISFNAKNQILDMLQQDPTRRPTAYKCLSSYWVNGKACHNYHLKTCVEKLGTYRQRHTLRDRHQDNSQVFNDFGVESDDDPTSPVQDAEANGVETVEIVSSVNLPRPSEHHTSAEQVTTGDVKQTTSVGSAEEPAGSTKSN